MDYNNLITGDKPWYQILMEDMNGNSRINKKLTVQDIEAAVKWVHDVYDKKCGNGELCAELIKPCPCCGRTAKMLFDPNDKKSYWLFGVNEYSDMKCDSVSDGARLTKKKQQEIVDTFKCPNNAKYECIMRCTMRSCECKTTRAYGSTKDEAMRIAQYFWNNGFVYDDKFSNPDKNVDICIPNLFYQDFYFGSYKTFLVEKPWLQYFNIKEKSSLGYRLYKLIEWGDKKVQEQKPKYTPKYSSKYDYADPEWVGGSGHREMFGRNGEKMDWFG